MELNTPGLAAARLVLPHAGEPHVLLRHSLANATGYLFVAPSNVGLPGDRPAAKCQCRRAAAAQHWQEDSAGAAANRSRALAFLGSATAVYSIWSGPEQLTATYGRTSSDLAYGAVSWATF